MIKQWESLTPMKRMADPQELCGAAVYLASDAASFTTGSDIIVGRRLHRDVIALPVCRKVKRPCR